MARLKRIYSMKNSSILMATAKLGPDNICAEPVQPPPRNHRKASSLEKFRSPLSKMAHKGDAKMSIPWLKCVAVGYL